MTEPRSSEIYRRLCSAYDRVLAADIGPLSVFSREWNRARRAYWVIARELDEEYERVRREVVSS